MTLYVVNGLAYGNLLFLMAAGFTLIFGVLRVINMAHGSLYLLGAHVAISVAQSGAGIWAGILAGSIVAAAIGSIAERFLLYRLQGDYLAQVLVTIGLFMIIGDLALLYWGGTPRVFTLPPELVYSIPVGALRYPADRLVLLLVGPLIAVALWYAIERTRFGATVRASVDDEEIAQAIGVSVPRLRLLVFATGSLLAGLSGALGATFVGAKPGLDLEVILLALVIVIIGGPGSLVGSYIAALLIGILDSIGKSLFPEASLFLLFAPMLLILMLRPNGLFGRPVTENAIKPDLRPIVIPMPQAAIGIASAAVDQLKRLPGSVWLILAASLMLALPFLMSEYTLGIVTLALIWAVFAIGLNIMLGYGGMPSLGHALFFGVGAYATAWSGLAGLNAHLGLLLSIVGAAITACILAGVSLRTRQAQLLLVTLALAQVVWGVVFKWRSVTGGDDDLIHPQQFGVFKSFGHAAGSYVNVTVIFAASAFVYWLFARSRLRLNITGIRSNEKRMMTLGYNTARITFVTYVVSGMFSGLAGGLYAIYSGFVAPDLFSVYTSAKVLLMVILGMPGMFAGPVIGAFALIGLEEILSGLTARWHSLLGCIYIMVAMLAFGGVRFGRQQTDGQQGGAKP